MATVKIKYCFYNRATRSVAKGTYEVRCRKGQGFHDVSDKLKTMLTRMKKRLLAQILPGECPDEWELLTFSNWAEWNARKQRAQKGDD